MINLFWLDFYCYHKQKKTIRKIFYNVEYEEYEETAMKELRNLLFKENIVLPSM